MITIHRIEALFHWIHLHPILAAAVWLTVAIAAFLWFTQDAWRGNPNGLSPDEMLIPWPIILVLCLIWPVVLLALPFILAYSVLTIARKD